jgi:hypothetical protein
MVSNSVFENRLRYLLNLIGRCHKELADGLPPETNELSLRLLSQAQEDLRNLERDRLSENLLRESRRVVRHEEA